ncbi:MAG: ABC transporter substrate-binding protein [Bdellovibrionota bacterium]|nr:MAG: ABC transporter substrate-binding protein [Bdellovibrionota bacterium]
MKEAVNLVGCRCFGRSDLFLPPAQAADNPWPEGALQCRGTFRALRLVVALLFICAALIPQGLQAEEELRIGAIFSLSGWAQIPGTLELHGAELAVSDINEQGGVLGKRLRLVVEDGGSDLKNSVTAFQKLKASFSPPVLIGPNFAEFAEVVAPYAQAAGMVMITPSGYTDNLTMNRNGVFTLNEGFGAQIAAVTRHIIENRYKEVVIVRTHGSYFDGIADAASTQLAAGNVRVREDIAVNPKQEEYRSIVARVKAAQAPVVIALLQEGGDLAQFFRQSKEQKLEAIVYTYDVLFDSEIRDRMELAEGAICYRYTNNASEDFTRRFIDRFKVAPLYTSERAYDAVQLFKKALESCGGNYGQLPECIRNTRFQGQGGPVAFNRHNVLDHGGTATRLFAIRNGRYEALHNGERTENGAELPPSVAHTP